MCIRDRRHHDLSPAVDDQRLGDLGGGKGRDAVSYTHRDVYKRQASAC